MNILFLSCLQIAECETFIDIAFSGICIGINSVKVKFSGSALFSDNVEMTNTLHFAELLLNLISP